MVLAAVSLTCASAILVVWSRELKQYQTEAFIFVLMALLVFRLRRCDGRANFLILASGILVLTVVGPWLGYGVLFSAPGLLAMLLVLRPVKGRRFPCIVVGFTGLLLLGGSAMLLVWLAAGEQAENAGVLAFNGHWFIQPLSLRSWLRAGAYFCMAGLGAISPFHWAEALPEDHLIWALAPGAVVWAMVLFGALAWPRRERLEISMCVFLPWLLMLLASLGQKYPFSAPRMMAMWTSLLPLLIGAGMVYLGKWCAILLTGRGRSGILLASMLTVVPVVHLLLCHEFHTRYVHQDYPSLLAIVEQERWPGETVIATLLVSPSARFYSQQMGTKNVVCMPTTGGTCKIAEYDYEALIRETIRSTPGRVWVLTIATQEFTRSCVFRHLEGAKYDCRLRAADPNPSACAALQLFCAQKRAF